MPNKKRIPVHKVNSLSGYDKLHNDLTKRGFVALDVLKSQRTSTQTLGGTDDSNIEAKAMETGMSSGYFCGGPLKAIAFAFDDRTNTVTSVPDASANGKDMGLGYVNWGSGDCIPSTIPVWAQSLPYTASPLRYIADLISGLGVRLMYRFPDGELVLYKDAGVLLRQKVEELEELEQEQPLSLLEYNPLVNTEDQEKKPSSALKHAREALAAWERTWNGYDEEDEQGEKTHIPGAKDFLDDNNLDLHLAQCMQDHVMLDIYFPTIGFQRGRRGTWNPKIVQVGHLDAATCRLEKQNEYGHINHVYRSESLRTKGAGVSSVNSNTKFVMYPAAMPQHTLSDLRYIVKENQRTSIKGRPTWVVCPTFYPSLNKPYYPQPAWWSIFTSKAFDFSSTILFDKAKQRENATTWGRIVYISLDYLEQVYADEGYAGNPDKQQEFIDELDQSIEDFLQHRENTGKTMRQWKWEGKDGKDHYNVEIADVSEAKKDAIKAGKEELELSTSPIFLALGVDPRLVGVPMVQASNGGTALREMHLLKQQQLSIHQRLYEGFLNNVVKWNGWDNGNAEFHIIQQTLTTLDNSKTGTVETISSEGA